MMNGYYPEGWIFDTATNKKYFMTPTDINDALDNRQILEATAFMCDSHHNLLVNLGCMTGVIPRSDGAIGIDDGSVRDIALISRVGKPVCFTVQNIETDESGKLYAVLSRRAAQIRCRNEFIAKLRPGDIVPARITHLENFGAFCDIGCGIIALLPIDSISVSRISHPKDRFYTGQDIKAIIKQISPDGKITLTHKELLGTWQENAQLFSPGQTVSGIIRSVESYGVFVELAPNLAGLAEPHPNARVGHKASVYIKSIIPEKMKVKLIIIDSFEDDEIIPCEYFYSEDHIDSWQYSASGCHKLIYTDF